MKLWTIWVDEVGRGAWAWPVVAASIFWAWRCPIKGILWDSKKLSSSEREKTYQEIVQLSLQWKLYYGVWIIENTVIDVVGIREANRLAMLQSLQRIQNTECKIYSKENRLMIDGRDNYQFDIVWLPAPKYIIRWDSKVKQIMAASILAKVIRDNLMRDFEKEFPGYGFVQHKGYGTRLHQKTLQKLGVSEIHRRSYKPIVVLLSK